MTAPTLVQCLVTRASGTSAVDLPSVLSGGPTAGDLCIIVAGGANGAVSTVTDVTYTSGGASAGYTEHVNQASSGGTNRLRVWSKVLTASDYAAVGAQRDMHSLTLAGWTNTGTARWGVYVVRHASGWDTDRVLEIDLQTANVANGTTVGSIAKTRAGLMLTGLIGMSTVQVAYNGGTAIEPYTNDGTTSDADGPLASPAPGDHGTNFGSGNSSIQADLQAYDVGSATITIAPSLGLNNTSHVFGAIYFQVADTEKAATKTDAVGITDTATRLNAANRTINDPIGIDDDVPTPNLPTSYTRTFTDPVGIVDVVPRDLAQTKTDAVGIVDTGTVLNSRGDSLAIFDEVFYDLARGLTEPLGITDAVSFALPGVRGLNDAVGITDTLTVDQVVSDLTASCLATIVWNDPTLKVVWTDLRAAVRWCS